jgi:tetrapyrrole methylase family protein/MazG family protein
MKSKKSLEDITSLVKTLRGPKGCPWDREQTLTDLKSYLIGETYEILDAIDQNNPEHIKEEAGDVLFLVIFLIDILEEASNVTIHDVIAAVTEKMIRRHPHVFGNGKAKTSDEVKANWQTIKQELEGKPASNVSKLDGVPAFLPALTQAQFLTQKASKVGFDWQTPQQVFEKIEEELAELKESMAKNDHSKTAAELGDVLFSLVNLSRFLEIDSEAVLRKTIKKFTERFHFIEQALHNAGRDITKTSLDELELLWKKAKTAES